MSWNYRVCTRIFSYKKEFPKAPEMSKMEDQRIFSILEVYYDKDGNVNGYIDETKNSLAAWEDYDDLKGTHELMKLAFEKPILDLDNWPKFFGAEKQKPNNTE